MNPRRIRTAVPESIAALLPAIAAVAVALAAAATAARSQDVAAAAAAPAAPRVAEAAASSDRWLLLCCGLPGDQDHRGRLTNACRQIIESAPQVLGVAPERLLVLAGDEEMQAELDGVTSELGLCTAESIGESIERLAAEATPQAGCFVILLGHGHLQGDRSQFNVSGPDIDQTQFASMTEPLRCREQVFVLTFPVSGFWTSPLAAAGRGSATAQPLSPRVIIAATEADLEFTATEFPYALADVLAGGGSHAALEDIDQDGRVNVLDLYLVTSLEVHKRFESAEQLATEHAQLDDNGDGRSSELQQAYIEAEAAKKAAEEAAAAEAAKAEEAAADEALTEEAQADEAVVEEAEADSPKASAAEAPAARPQVILRESLDGYRSRQIPLRKLASETQAD